MFLNIMTLKECFKDITQIPEHFFNEMKHFFSVYKELENKKTAVNEVQGKENAIKIIKSALYNYKVKFKTQK